MEEAVMERTHTFRAVHHYARRDRTPERNREVFGDLADPHAHDYRVTVRVAGPMDPVTGFCVDLATLDDAVLGMLEPLRDGDLNQAVADFRDGGLLPSCENLARWIYRRLQDVMPSPARVLAVRVAESPDLAAVYPAP